MSKELDLPTVKKVAELARLNLTDDELRSIAGQLKAVLENFQQIAAVDTNGIEPLVTPTDLEVRFREDRVETTNEKGESEIFLMNAPARSGRLFKVPPVVS